MVWNDQSPIYLQIAEYIVDKILLSEWNGGDRIPSVRELAADIEVNPNTVVRTYGLLSDQEIIYNKRGIGYFLDEQALEKAQSYRRNRFLEEELPQVIKTMKLLNIDFKELESHFNKYKK